MPIVMIAYYIISAFLLAMLIWNFIREKKNVEHMILYLILIIPLVLRLLRIQ
jgi:hypothetical protein